MPLASAALRAELAPTGKLRVGVNHSNFLIVSGKRDGVPVGVAPDLGGELARRLGVPLEFVEYHQAGDLAAGAKNNAWDIGFLGAEPQRANEIAFSPAYLEIPVTYLVPAGSKIRTLADVDRPGVRVAVSEKSAYDLYLSRTLKHAQLVRAKGIDASYDLFVSQKLEVLGGLKPRLIQDVEKLPGARILDGRVTAVQQAIGTPVARQAAAKYLREFVEEAKASGFVAGAIEKHKVRGVSVAPQAGTQ
ncbi:MAG TPA: transporter substrate-binding domain-containing protein [Burkholderiales bacterium]|nr:transporter substrate-binding domain-containing protein [Burkholderiales bacterium]